MTTPFPTDLSGGALAVATRGLSKRYGTHRGIQDLTLQVPVGAVYLLVGPNGAGKSTTIRLLLDLVHPTAGAAEVFGLNPRAHPAVVRANVGYVPEQLNWGYGWMRVGRLLEHHSRYYPSWDAKYAQRLMSAFDWTMPVAQPTHTLTKVFAGWTWTMALTAVLLICRTEPSCLA